MDKPYNTAYEQRYRAVYKAGAKYWGFAPDNADLNSCSPNG